MGASITLDILVEASLLARQKIGNILWKTLVGFTLHIMGEKKLVPIVKCSWEIFNGMGKGSWCFCFYFCFCFCFFCLFVFWGGDYIMEMFSCRIQKENKHVKSVLNKVVIRSLFSALKMFLCLSDVRFLQSCEKNMSFLVIPKSPKFEKIGLGSFKMHISWCNMCRQLGLRF